MYITACMYSLCVYGTLCIVFCIADHADDLDDSLSSTPGLMQIQLSELTVSEQCVAHAWPNCVCLSYRVNQESDDHVDWMLDFNTPLLISCELSIAKPLRPKSVFKQVY